MLKVRRHHLARRKLLSVFGARVEQGRCYRKLERRLGLLAAVVLLAPLGFAQGAPKVTGVDPSAGKVNDTVTVTGEDLDKATVSAVFLSDDKTDYKATIEEQSADKIVARVPRVKPGNYNVSIQVGNSIYIQPVLFTVQE
ncbi:MAG TPA: IPT/TIG domain-containing protein [Candidatus Polarisedimenticolia bacterium]|nr:IPT/TIG domain-containing protein [Candidatus Polarisedimenticolia bacterium]